MLEVLWCVACCVLCGTCDVYVCTCSCAVLTCVCTCGCVVCVCTCGVVCCVGGVLVLCVFACGVVHGCCVVVVGWCGVWVLCWCCVGVGWVFVFFSVFPLILFILSLALSLSVFSVFPSSLLSSLFSLPFSPTNTA